MKAALAAAATGIQVGAAIVATRYAIADVGPFSLAFIRYLIGVLLLAPLVLLTVRTRIAGRDILPVALLGIGQFGVLIVLLNIGLKTVPSGLGALLFATFPFMTLVLAAVLGREKPTVGKLAGVTVCIAGVGLAVGADLWDLQDAETSWFGIALILASAFTGALCSVYYRPYLQKYPTLLVSTFAMAASVAFLLVPAVPEGLIADSLTLAPETWVAAAFIGFSSAVGYLCWLYALKHLSPTRVTVYLSLSPVTGALLGAVILGEPVSAPVLAGSACVTIGLWLTGRGSG